MASTALVSLSNNLAKRFGIEGDGVLDTLKATAFKGQVSDAQMTALLIVAQQYGLNPWTREIYAFPDKNNGIVPVVGVDGWARIINDNKHFDGMDFEMDEAGKECTCIIHRKDRQHPIKVTEYLDECKRGTQPWQSHPRRMLRHKAMIQCARLAFGFGGIFDQDEAERIVEKDITSESQVIGAQIQQKTPPAPEYLPNDDFAIIKDKYKGTVASGKKSASDLVAWIEAKGKLMTDAQKMEVSTWAKPEVIEGELVDDPFVTELEAAEGATA